MGELNFKTVIVIYYIWISNKLLIETLISWNWNILKFEAVFSEFLTFVYFNFYNKY